MLAFRPRYLLSSAILLSLLVVLSGCGSGGTLIVANPTFLPAAGSYATPQSVTLADGISDAELFYTTDGSLPTAHSSRYTGPIAVTSSETIQAIGVIRGFLPSAVVTASYTIALPAAAPPTFTPAAGSYPVPQAVALTDATPAATIFYTTDGSAPTTASTQYTTPIPVATSTTLQAIATAPNYAASPVATAVYNIALPAALAPTFNPPAGNYASAQSITLADATPNASIFYTTDGSTPTSASAQYTTPIPVATSTTLQAIATAPNYAPSPVASAAYILTLPTASEPAFSPAPGNYPSAQTITLSDVTPGASIFYSTDGTPPALPYTAPFTIATNTTVAAYASASGYSNSPTAFATYTFGAIPSGQGDWTWMGGSNAASAPAVYGTLGVPSPTNNPGARGPGATFTDNNGNLWLFGGTLSSDTSYFLGYLNDLWKFDPSSLQWTWMGGSNTVNASGNFGTLGVPSVNNIPPPRDGSTFWKDADGNFWIFGGLYQTTGEIERGDLWRFNPTTLEWTWMGGSQDFSAPPVYGTRGLAAASNYPGARDDGAAATDHAGNLYLFGGFSQAANFGNDGYLNDLWKYNIASGLWTWLGGSNTYSQPGVYGTLGVPAPANTPGARVGDLGWTDQSGNLWIFGGSGYDSTPNTQGYLLLNDLWKFDTTTQLWTWISGSNVHNDLGNYGTLGVPSPTNVPPSRFDGVQSWTDHNGDLWLFGGAAMSHIYNSPTVSSDLWRFNIATSQWTWMAGPNEPAEVGQFGLLGIPGATNTPGSRDDVAAWVDLSGNLWLFSGFGDAADQNAGALNDLWRYQP